MYLLSPGYSWKIAYLGFNYNHSLTLLLLQVIHWKNTVTRWQKMFKWYGRLILKIITKMVDYGSSSMEKFMMFRNLDYLPNVERAIWKSMLVGFSKKNQTTNELFQVDIHFLDRGKSEDWLMWKITTDINGQLLNITTDINGQLLNKLFRDGQILNGIGLMKLVENPCLHSTNTLRTLRFRFMVFYATFINISVISWQSVLLVEYPEKTTDLSKVTDKLYYITLYWAWTGFQLTTLVVLALIAQVVVNQTTIRSRPRQPEEP